MLLYHFSNYDFKVLKTSYFGQNSYSTNEKKACNIEKPINKREVKHFDIQFNNVKINTSVIAQKRG